MKEEEIKEKSPKEGRGCKNANRVSEEDYNEEELEWFSLLFTVQAVKYE